MSDVLVGLGVLAVAVAAAAAILLPPGRPRSVAMLIALGLSPALILGDQWHSAEVTALRDDPARFTGLTATALAMSAALAAAFHRKPVLLPLAIVAALPFRIPIEAGGEEANLLVPLYVVIASGVFVTAYRTWTDPLASTRRAGPSGPATYVWLPRLLAAFVLLYGLQTLYSLDFSNGLQTLCFFLAPFSLAYAILREVRWSRRLLALALALVAASAALFVAVGTVEYLTRELLWNQQVIRSNEFHSYFRVNSLFWDPNIYGRYLALALALLVGALLWARQLRTTLALAGLCALLWVGLVPTFSQSSFAALLGGLAILAALRWSARWTAAALAVGGVAALAAVLAVGGSLKVDFSRPNIDTSGRANLVSGGIELYGERPFRGYGAGSFPTAFRDKASDGKAPVSESHTEPITVAAEQGTLALFVYLGILICAIGVMTTGMRRTMPGLRSSHLPPGDVDLGDHPEQRPQRRGGGTKSAAGPGGPAARAGIVAAFAALVVHTMAYAGFFDDPITWVLLAIGASLAAATLREQE